jgi:hypothetical protein
MEDNGLDQTEDSLRDADAAGRIRARMLLALGAFVLVWVFADGLLIWGDLPNQIPTHFGGGGVPNSWGAKNAFNVFGPLVMGAIILLAMALLRYRPRWYNFPGKEKAARLPLEQQAHVYAPLQESLAWLGSGEAIAMSLLSRQMWAAALLQRHGISPVVFVVPTVVGIGAVILGSVATSRRLRALGE